MSLEPLVWTLTGKRLEWSLGAGVKWPGVSLNQKRNWPGDWEMVPDLGLSSLIEERKMLAPTFLVRLMILNIAVVFTVHIFQQNMLEIIPERGDCEA